MTTKANKFFIDLVKRPLQNITVLSGSIDNTPIGTNTPAIGKFTSATVGGNSLGTAAYTDVGIGIGQMPTHDMLGSIAYQNSLDNLFFIPSRIFLTPGGSYFSTPVSIAGQSTPDFNIIANTAMDVSGFTTVPANTVMGQFRSIVKLAITSGTRARALFYHTTPTLISNIAPGCYANVISVRADQVTYSVSNTYNVPLTAVAPTTTYRIDIEDSVSLVTATVSFGMILEGFWMTQT